MNRIKEVLEVRKIKQKWLAEKLVKILEIDPKLLSKTEKDEK